MLEGIGGLRPHPKTNQSPPKIRQYCTKTDKTVKNLSTKIKLAT